MSKGKALVVLNPVSGVRDKSYVRRTVEGLLDYDRYNWTFLVTEYPGHGFEASLDSVRQGYDIVVAIGGDGTVNEAGRALTTTSTLLGIIPTGSGNGLANFLRVPRKVENAVKCINRRHSTAIDTASLNGHFFCSIAGVGFDAKVARLFENSSSRGLMTYLKIIIKEYLSYKPSGYKVITGNDSFNCAPLLISVANSNQFGNHAVIAPKAKADDGLLDVCVMNKVAWYKLPYLGLMMLLGRVDRTGYIDYFKTGSISIMDVNGMHLQCHIDGNPLDIETSTINITVLPRSLNVIVPDPGAGTSER